MAHSYHRTLSSVKKWGGSQPQTAARGNRYVSVGPRVAIGPGPTAISQADPRAVDGHTLRLSVDLEITSQTD
jgi:hypothetical protein